MTDLNRQNAPLPPEDDLARRLRDDAAGELPEFSESLHARIVESLPARPNRPAVIDIPAHWRIVGTAVSALVIVGVLLAWQLDAFNPSRVANSEPDNIEQRMTEEDIQTVAIATISRAADAEVGLMVDQTFATGQWAYLDHDAKVAAQLLRDQIPFELALAERQP